MKWNEMLAFYPLQALYKQNPTSIVPPLPEKQPITMTAMGSLLLSDFFPHCSIKLIVFLFSFPVVSCHKDQYGKFWSYWAKKETFGKFPQPDCATFLALCLNNFSSISWSWKLGNFSLLLPFFYWSFSSSSSSSSSFSNNNKQMFRPKCWLMRQKDCPNPQPAFSRVWPFMKEKFRSQIQNFKKLEIRSIHSSSTLQLSIAAPGGWFVVKMVPFSIPSLPLQDSNQTNNNNNKNAPELSSDYAELGAVFNQFSLSEKELAPALEKCGVAVDNSFLGLRFLVWKPLVLCGIQINIDKPEQKTEDKEYCNS